MLTRKLKVAVLLSSSEKEGGAFVQSLNIARLLAPRGDAPYTVEYVTIDKSDQNRLRQAGLTVQHSTSTTARSLFSVLDHFPLIKTFLRRVYLFLFKESDWLDKFAEKNGYDVLVFTSNSRLMLNVKRTPFFLTVWDMCHLDNPEFPEYATNNSVAWREYLHRSVLPRASGYIVDTEQLADRVAWTYTLDRSKAIIIPYQASDEIIRAPQGEREIQNLRQKHGLSRPFLFYPAQFWPHKNHAYILKALDILRKRGVMMDAVFSGADRSGLAKVQSFVQRENLQQQVKFVGFLPTEEIAQMYRAATVAVMPSYFGPTNIPPLEAEALGCHFIYSDLPGYRDFAGPDCLYCDLTRPEHLADLIVEASGRAPRMATPRMPDSDQISARLNHVFSALSAKIAAWKY